MREIEAFAITDAIERLCIRAATVLTPDLRAAIESAAEREPSEAGRGALCDMVENFRCASDNGLPICQDTGMAVVFADLGQEVHITGGDFEEAITEGVRRGYVNGYLRKSVVADPFRRINTGDNTPPVIWTRLVPGDRLTLTVAPKGFGSENKSRMKMFLPSAKIEEFEDFIAETVDHPAGTDGGLNNEAPALHGEGHRGVRLAFEKPVQLPQLLLRVCPHILGDLQLLLGKSKPHFVHSFLCTESSYAPRDSIITQAV